MTSFFKSFHSYSNIVCKRMRASFIINGSEGEISRTGIYKNDTAKKETNEYCIYFIWTFHLEFQFNGVTEIMISFSCASCTGNVNVPHLAWQASFILCQMSSYYSINEDYLTHECVIIYSLYECSVRTICFYVNKSSFSRYKNSLPPTTGKFSLIP